MILLNDGRACGVWPLSLTTLPAIGSNGGALVPPLFTPDVPATTCKRITLGCLEFLDTFLRANAVTSWESSEAFSGKLGRSEWHDRAMKRGCTATLRQELFVDLSLDLATIRSGLRKSYRSLISAGEKLWNVAILEQADGVVCSQFRELHALAAGRLTRSPHTWELQHAAVGSGTAFLVYLCDSTGRMVGAGRFT